jgi:hypothetical protein
MQIPISVDMLYEIECGKRKAAPDVVMRMAELYGDPYLVIEAHKQYHPEYHAFYENVLGVVVERTSLGLAALRYINEQRDLAGAAETAGKISSNDRIDPCEQSALETVWNETTEFIGPAISFRLASIGGNAKTALREAACR